MQLLYAILYGLQCVQGERTVSSIYHLLKGKRSSQTIQDSVLYRLSFLFGVYKQMQRQAYDEQIQQLLAENCIKQIQENTYIVTEAGEKRLKVYSTSIAFPKHLDGLKYGEVGEILWKRLSLLIQTLSHLQKKRAAFLPVQQEQYVTNWVKSFLLTTGASRMELSQALYEECRSVLAELPEMDCSIFVLRLSSHERVGYTEEQIATMLQEDVSRIHILFLSVLHTLAKHGLGDEKRYPLLGKLSAYKQKSVAALSTSTIKTYELWKLGRTMEEIVSIRRLKRSTIEDHFVEIALHHPHFPIHAFLPHDKQQKIIQVIEEMGTRKLKNLKERAGDNISYFDIRLLLAVKEGKYEA